MSIIGQVDGLFAHPVDLNTLLDEIPMGIIVLDTGRRIVYMNRSATALTGYSANEARGIACHHILRSRICIKDCPLSRLSRNAGPLCLQSDLINRERQRIPIRVTVTPLSDTNGNIVGYIETIEDIRPFEMLGGEQNRGFGFSSMVGRSPEMEKLFAMLPLIAQNDSSVLITGETGTGKDLVAEAIHETSSRAKGPFIKINCGALPETLLESELFGHRKGAFTGAVENKPGRFKLAHNGTLFLTEIGDLPLALQVKILTFLDDHIIFPLGSTKGVEVNVRVIAGTHRDLEQMVKSGGFRQDLLFRLNVIRIHIPPLRDRGDDIRLLIDHFLNKFSSHFGKKISGFSESALSMLRKYPYPGNVRELRNIIEYAVNVCQGPRIEVLHLPAYLFEPAKTAPRRKDATTSSSLENAAGLAFAGKGMPAGTWRETEKEMIINAMIKARGRRNKAADLLGWGRSTLWRKMKEYRIT